jgi:uncharacterized protein (DUF4213/DUF364 family)
LPEVFKEIKIHDLMTTRINLIDLSILKIETYSRKSNLRSGKMVFLAFFSNKKWSGLMAF